MTAGRVGGRAAVELRQVEGCLPVPKLGDLDDLIIVVGLVVALAIRMFAYLTA